MAWSELVMHELMIQSWPGALKGKLELLWEHPHSPSYSGPVVHHGLVFTTETINKEIERVTAYRLSSGEKVWSTQWPGAMSVPFFAAANGSWIRATPVCVPGHLLVVGMLDVLVCLEPETGNEKWRVDFPGEMGGPLPAFGAASSPIVDGDGVIMQTGGAVVRLNLADGSLVWKTLESGTRHDVQWCVFQSDHRNDRWCATTRGANANRTLRRRSVDRASACGVKRSKHSVA